MATPSEKSVLLGGLAKRLVQEDYLEEAVAEQAYVQAAKQKVSFVAYLIQQELVNSLNIATAASDEFGVPLFDLSSLDNEVLPKGLVSEKLIRQHHALPLYRRGNRLYVGISDPTNLRALDDIKFHTGLIIDPVVVQEDKLSQVIEGFLESQDNSASFTNLADADLDDLDIEGGDEDTGDTVTQAETEDAPIVRFVNKILLDAIKEGASDIHFEPYEKIFRIRFRTDGILHEVTRPPSNLASRLCARLKVMAQLDISERRVPQDGRIKMKLSKNKAIDFRVNTLPTIWGEKIVLRILDPSSAKLGIDALGYEDFQKALFMQTLDKPQGMILVTGPTGSGKTVSLYTGLNILNSPERNISTAEDPVEINLEGINQVNVRPKIGLDFSSALRSFLRQDPDVIMVGEIRDLETAEIAVKAAQTGHLVLSTLHTNSAAETLTRLRNMGIPSFNIATSVSLIIAQRLARRLCNKCKKPMEIPEKVLLEAGFAPEQIPNITIFEPVGCNQCNNGYKGRVGIYEVVPITKGIAKLIMEDSNSIQIAEQARAEGYIDLRTAGLRKAAAGLTSLIEVNRVTMD